jgi:RNA polymerase sigma-32 factor
MWGITMNEYDPMSSEPEDYIKYVKSTVVKYKNYHASFDDLFQEGMIGLIKAKDRYDASTGVPFLAYAKHWIRASINEFIICNFRDVKVTTTKSRRKLFFNIRRLRSELGGNITIDEARKIASDLDVPLDDVIIMDHYMSNRSLETRFNQEHDVSDDNNMSFELPDVSSDPAVLVEESEHQQYMSERIREALEHLPERECFIVKSRILADKEDKLGLAELAEIYNISKERVRQLEMKALEKLRNLLN